MGGGSSSSLSSNSFRNSPNGSSPHAEVLLRNTSVRGNDILESVRSKFSKLSSHDEVSLNTGNGKADYVSNSNSMNSVATGGSGRTELGAIEEDGEMLNMLDESMAKDKFEGLVNAENPEILEKDKVIELVQWVQRLSHDKKKTENIIGIFTNCLDDGGITFDEFCNMYEEITTRVELQVMFETRFKQMDIFNSGYLMRPDLIAMTDFVLVHFAKVWCSTREIVDMKKKMVNLFETMDDDKMSRVELFEVFDSMLVTIRLISLTKKKFKEYDKDGSGALDAHELLALSEWILKSFRRNGVDIGDEEKIELRHQLMSTYGDNNNGGQITFEHLTFLFESIREKKQWFGTLNTITNAQQVVGHLSQSSSLKSSRKSKSRRLSFHTFEDISESQLTAIGITPLIREKFVQLDVYHKGVLDLAEICNLVRYMYFDQAAEGEKIIAEIETGWEDRPLDFDEFCSMYDDVFTRLDLSGKFDIAFQSLSKDRFVISKSHIKQLVEAVFYSAEKIGCSESERTKIITKLAATFSHFQTPTVTKDDLKECLDEIGETIRLLKGVSKKFNELDIDGSGVLDGEEILHMSEWVIRLNNPNPGYKPSEKEVFETKKTLLSKFNRGPNGSISMRDLGVIYEDLLKQRRMNRIALRYKHQVKNLIVELMTEPSIIPVIPEERLPHNSSTDSYHRMRPDMSYSTL